MERRIGWGIGFVGGWLTERERGREKGERVMMNGYESIAACRLISF